MSPNISRSYENWLDGSRVRQSRFRPYNIVATFLIDRLVPILLQKSKVVGLRIFRENAKEEAIPDSYNLSRVTEVAGEFSVGR
jgi:hypothetical protein